MDFQQIRYEVADAILTITLDRPDRLNAWTPTMASELIEAFDRADADDDVRAIVVTGAGRAYCAGADLAGGGETFDWRERQSGDEVPRDNGGQVTLRIFDSTKPVIAAINGPAVGVGITMTLPMDIRLAAEDARIGFVFARPGSRTASATACPRSSPGARRRPTPRRGPPGPGRRRRPRACPGRRAPADPAGPRASRARGRT